MSNINAKLIFLSPFSYQWEQMIGQLWFELSEPGEF